MIRACVTAAALALLAGCAGKLNVEKPFALPSEGGDHDALFNLPAQSADQQVKVEVTADQAVDVYVFLKDGDADPRELGKADRLKKAVASKKGATAETLTVTVPKGKECQVVVHQPKRALATTGRVKFQN